MDDPILISRNVECGTLHCTGGNAKPRYTAQNTYSTHNRKFDNREVQVTVCKPLKKRSSFCLHKDQTECQSNLMEKPNYVVGFLKIVSEQNIRQVV